MKNLLLLLGLIVSSPMSHAWTVTADFEDGSIGQIATGSDGLTSNAAQATYTNEYVYSGSQPGVISTG